MSEEIIIGWWNKDLKNPIFKFSPGELEEDTEWYLVEISLKLLEKDKKILDLKKESVKLKKESRRLDRSVRDLIKSTKKTTKLC